MPLQVVRLSGICFARLNLRTQLLIPKILIFLNKKVVKKLYKAYYLNVVFCSFTQQIFGGGCEH